MKITIEIDEKEKQSKNEKIENHVFSDYMENLANDILSSRGYLFLNDVYDMLGFNRTRAGETVGWVYDEKNPIGDNCVIFDIVEIGNGVIAGTKYVK